MMDATREDRLEQLFDEALAMTPAQRASFLDEALLGLIVGVEVWRQKLQRNGATETHVDGLVHHAHASAAQPLDNAEVGDLIARARASAIARRKP